MSLLAAALEYANRGWPVLPLGAGGDRKRPRIRDWPNVASTDPDVIEGWWRRWPEADVAIVTGRRSGVVAIDLDDDDVGGDAYGTLLLEHGPPGSVDHPDGATIRTGRERGGWRLLFALPDGAEIGKGILAPGVEFMGAGGSAIMPPSRHASGRRYTWRDPIPTGGLPELSPAWVALLAPPPPARASGPAPRPADFDGLGTPYGAAALAGELERVATAEIGTRNHTLNAAAFAVGSLVATGHLDLDSATRELARLGVAVGLSEHEVAQTLESGIRAGLQNPRRERAA